MSLTEAKFASYNTMPFTQLRLGMRDGGTDRFIVVNTRTSPPGATSSYAELVAVRRRLQIAVVVSDPPWKRLVEDLKSTGHKSQHLERLQERLPANSRDGFRALELEILQEMASSLARAGDKVDHALLELEVLGHEIDAARDSAARARRVTAFNEKREVALKALWELKVHREAIGLRQHHALAQMYPIPPKRV